MNNEQLSNAKITEVHISQVNPGDTIMHQGKMQTVCANNIKKDSFIGRSIFGDSYNGGSKKVQRVSFTVPKNNGLSLPHESK